MEVSIARSDADILDCFSVFQVLRPHLEATSFLARVRSQEKQGYEIAYIHEDRDVVAAAGYRELEFLAWGRVFYVDDLIAAPARLGQGFGGAMMDWLISSARQRMCSELHLDSGYQRHAAHRLYLSKGLQLNCHHFALKLAIR